MIYICHNCGKEFEEPYVLSSKLGYDERCPYCGSISIKEVKK